MKNISLAIAFAFTLFFASACNTPGCAVESEVVSVASGFLVGALQCSNPAAVSASLTSLISAVIPTLCTSKNSKPEGPIANTLCPIVASSVVNFIAANGIPASWGCTAANASQLVTGKLTALCEQLPVSAH